MKIVHLGLAALAALAHGPRPSPASPRRRDDGVAQYSHLYDVSGPESDRLA